MSIGGILVFPWQRQGDRQQEAAHPNAQPIPLCYCEQMVATGNLLTRVGTSSGLLGHGWGENGAGSWHLVGEVSPDNLKRSFIYLLVTLVAVFIVPLHATTEPRGGLGGGEGAQMGRDSVEKKGGMDSKSSCRRWDVVGPSFGRGWDMVGAGLAS